MENLLLPMGEINFLVLFKADFFYLTTYIHKMFINYSVFDKKMQYWMIYDFF